MFLQHSTPVTSDLTSVANPSADFDLIIKSKTKSAIKGQLRFTYLKQSFDAQIQISASTIQVILQYPFEGIIASTPQLQQDQIQEQPYLNNGALSNYGYQNIIWLQLDIIHLYNLIRFKPNAIVDLYRESFAFAKKQDNSIVYGHIATEDPVAKIAANTLAQIMKRKHKYVYGNSLNLLTSIQQIINSYPPHFLSPQHSFKKQTSFPLV
jgi:hypothetical protein